MNAMENGFISVSLRPSADRPSFSVRQAILRHRGPQPPHEGEDHPRPPRSGSHTSRSLTSRRLSVRQRRRILRVEGLREDLCACRSRGCHRLRRGRERRRDKDLRSHLRLGNLGLDGSSAIRGGSGQNLSVTHGTPPGNRFLLDDVELGRAVTRQRSHSTETLLRSASACTLIVRAGMLALLDDSDQAGAAWVFVVNPANLAPIPTASTWMLMALAGTLLLLGAMRVR
jgi:hypothetical protein